MFVCYSPEKRKDGNVYFLLETSRNNLRAHRSHKDFLWLRTTLLKLYPGVFVSNSLTNCTYIDSSVKPQTNHLQIKR